MRCQARRQFSATPSRQCFIWGGSRSIAGEPPLISESLDPYSSVEDSVGGSSSIGVDACITSNRREATSLADLVKSRLTRTQPGVGRCQRSVGPLRRCSQHACGRTVTKGSVDAWICWQTGANHENVSLKLPCHRPGGTWECVRGGYIWRCDTTSVRVCGLTEGSDWLGSFAL